MQRKGVKLTLHVCLTGDKCARIRAVEKERKQSDSQNHRESQRSRGSGATFGEGMMHAMPNTRLPHTDTHRHQHQHQHVSATGASFSCRSAKARERDLSPSPVKGMAGAGDQISGRRVISDSRASRGTASPSLTTASRRSLAQKCKKERLLSHTQTV